MFIIIVIIKKKSVPLLTLSSQTPLYLIYLLFFFSLGDQFARWTSKCLLYIYKCAVLLLLNIHINKLLTFDLFRRHFQIDTTPRH